MARTLFLQLVKNHNYFLYLFIRRGDKVHDPVLHIGMSPQLQFVPFGELKNGIGTFFGDGHEQSTLSPCIPIVVLFPDRGYLEDDRFFKGTGVLVARYRGKDKGGFDGDITVRVVLGRGGVHYFGGGYECSRFGALGTCHCR